MDAEPQGQTPTVRITQARCQLPLDPARQAGCKHEHAIITAIVILRAEEWNQVNQEMAEEARAGRSQSSGTDLGPSL